MSENLRKWMPTLCVISFIKDKKLQKSLIRYFTKKKKFNLALREISINIIKGSIKLSKYKKAILSKQRKIIYSIAHNKNPIKNSIQSGGSLFYIIPLIASLLMK